MGRDHWRSRPRAGCVPERARPRASLLYRRLRGLRGHRSLGTSHRLRSIEIRKRHSWRDQGIRLASLDHRLAADGCGNGKGASRHTLFTIADRSVCDDRRAARGRRALWRAGEIGVRMTLGAKPGQIFQLIVGQGLRLTTIGVAGGLIAAFVLTRGMSTMLVGVKTTDPATFAIMAMVFLFIAALASWLPAWRAASLDPTAALREE